MDILDVLSFYQEPLYVSLCLTQLRLHMVILFPHIFIILLLLPVRVAQQQYLLLLLFDGVDEIGGRLVSLAAKFVSHSELLVQSLAFFLF